MSNSDSPTPARLAAAISFAPLTLAAIGGILLLIVAGTLWTVHGNAELMRLEQHNAAELLADGLANAVTTPLVRHDSGALEARLTQAISLPGVHSAMVTDTAGRVLAHVRRDRRGTPGRPVYDVRAVTPPASSNLTILHSQPGSMTIWHPVEVGVALGWVRLVVSTERADSVIARMQRDTWLLALASALVGIGFLTEATRRLKADLQRRESALQHDQERLENIAYHDTLTGLPNRLLLSDRLLQAMANADRNQTSVAVCFIDHDDFKAVNDHHGHAIGDRLLVETARRLAEAVRGGDTVARLGGDEFVVLLCDLHGDEECERATQRLLAALACPAKFDDLDLPFSCSIGYAVFPGDSRSPEALLGMADHAMYDVKQGGGGKSRRYRAV